MRHIRAVARVGRVRVARSSSRRWVASLGLGRRGLATAGTASSPTGAVSPAEPGPIAGSPVAKDTEVAPGRVAGGRYAGMSPDAIVASREKRAAAMIATAHHLRHEGVIAPAVQTLERAIRLLELNKAANKGKSVLVECILTAANMLEEAESWASAGARYERAMLAYVAYCGGKPSVRNAFLARLALQAGLCYLRDGNFLSAERLCSEGWARVKDDSLEACRLRLVLARCYFQNHLGVEAAQAILTPSLVEQATASLSTSKVWNPAPYVAKAGVAGVTIGCQSEPRQLVTEVLKALYVLADCHTVQGDHAAAAKQWALCSEVLGALATRLTPARAEATGMGRDEVRFTRAQAHVAHVQALLAAGSVDAEQVQGVVDAGLQCLEATLSPQERTGPTSGPNACIPFEGGRRLVLWTQFKVYEAVVRTQDTHAALASLLTRLEPMSRARAPAMNELAMAALSHVSTAGDGDPYADFYDDGDAEGSAYPLMDEFDMMGPAPWDAGPDDGWCLDRMAVAGDALASAAVEAAMSPRANAAVVDVEGGGSPKELDDVRAAAWTKSVTAGEAVGSVAGVTTPHFAGNPWVRQAESLVLLRMALTSLTAKQWRQAETELQRYFDDFGDLPLAPHAVVARFALLQCRWGKNKEGTAAKDGPKVRPSTQQVVSSLASRLRHSRYYVDLLKQLEPPYHYVALRS